MTSAESTKKELERAVCMEPCAELSVTCCNGHMVCEKHFLQRAKAIYEEGRYAYDDKVQRCFLCKDAEPIRVPRHLFQKHFYVAYAITYFQSQGCTLTGRYTIWD